MKREDEFTKPRADCPNPGYWTAPDAYSTECEVTELVGAFVRALQPEYVVETGTAFGYTAAAVGAALAANGHGRLDTIEIDAEKVAEARRRCAGLPVSVVHSDSTGFDPAEQIGFAWFDSRIELRVPEFDRFRPWLATGTIVGFHDSGPQHALRPALDHLVSSNKIRALFLNTPRGVCFAEVL